MILDCTHDCYLKAVLDDMLLEVLPGIAVLAQQSSACSKSLAAICSLMAAACSPRDTITAFLEVLGNLAADRWAAAADAGGSACLCGTRCAQHTYVRDCRTACQEARLLRTVH